MSIPVFSILSTLGNAVANGVASHKANKVNQRNYETLKRYNTPIQQMGRFRSAGLNPFLIYTQTNEMSPAPEWRAPSFDFSALSGSSSELSDYQNINESVARVNNLDKQNKLLDEQINNQVLVNDYQDLLNKNYQDLTNIQKDEIQTRIDLNKKNLNLIDKQVEEICKRIEDYSKQWSFKAREISLQNARLVFDRLQSDRQFRLSTKELGLKTKQFDEFVRQFNVSHQLQNYIFEFLKGVTGHDNPSEAAKAFGVIVKKWISDGIDFNSQQNRFDTPADKIEDARQRGRAYKQGGRWHRPWDSDY